MLALGLMSGCSILFSRRHIVKDGRRVRPATRCPPQTLSVLSGHHLHSPKHRLVHGRVEYAIGNFCPGPIRIEPAVLAAVEVQGEGKLLEGRTPVNPAGGPHLIDSCHETM